MPEPDLANLPLEQAAAQCFFSLECRLCDTDGPESLAQALADGWEDIYYDDGARWNFLGTCPDCVQEEKSHA